MTEIPECAIEPSEIHGDSRVGTRVVVLYIRSCRSRLELANAMAAAVEIGRYRSGFDIFIESSR